MLYRSLILMKKIKKAVKTENRSTIHKYDRI